MKFKKIFSFPLLIILFGIFFSLYLQGQIAPEVYFSGDGGLKALLAKQLASGELRFDLITPALSWVDDLWEQGLYPYEPPFVYNVDSKYFITFPYTFPLITAPFYGLFGERGLYFIPLISSWIIWINFYWICLKIKLPKFSIIWGLIALIFTSYLTIYSVMYWEHTLAVALCFAGISIYILGNYPQQRNYKIAIFSGILIGLSVWFRPEFLCMVALLSGMVIFAAWKFFIREFADKRFNIKEYATLAVKKEAFIASMITTVAGFFLSNKLIYGHALGIHGIQAVEKVALSDRILGAWLNFIQMSLALPEYLPIIYFPLAYFSLFLISLFIFKNQIKFNLGWLAVVFLASLLLIIGVAILVPVGTAGLIPGGKQWGVRFLLVLVPIITLLATIEFNELSEQLSSWKKYCILLLFSFLIAIGCQKNIVQALTVIENNTQDTLPAIEFLQQDKHQVIAISQHFVGQALEASVNKNKLFFKLENTEQLFLLAKSLIEQNILEFTYICYPHRACPVPETNVKDLQFIQSDRSYQITRSNLGKFGKYPIYQFTINNRS